MTASGLIKAALAFGLAAGLHLAAFAALPDAVGANAGAGEEGADLMSLTAATGELGDLIASWDRPPIPSQSPPEAPEAPAPADAPLLPRLSEPQGVSRAAALILPQMTAPVADAAPLALPPPPPEIIAAKEPPSVAPLISPAPKARPPNPEAKAKPARQTPKKSAAPGQKAAGTGKGAVAGSGGTAQATTLSRAATNSLKASWGGGIRARIEAQKQYPSGADGAVGKVTLRLTVARGGALAGVSVIRSSGNAALDQAALRAVKRAGRFPAAPKGLGDATYSFSLPISFSR